MLRKYPVPQTGLSLYYARKGTGLTLDMEYSSFFIVLIYFPAKLTKVCRYKDFYLFIFPSANIIERAKALNLKAFALSGRFAFYQHYPGRCPGLGAFGLSARPWLPLSRLMTHPLFCNRMFSVFFNIARMIFLCF